MQADKTILQMKYARIVQLFAERNALTYADALGIFYDSDTYRLMSAGVADLHCLSDAYLADELEREWKAGQQPHPAAGRAEKTDSQL